MASTTTNETDSVSPLDRVKPESWGVWVTAVLMGLVIGGFAAWSTANMGIAGGAFLIGWIGSAWYLNKKSLPSEAAGSGMYITALLMLLTPILFYLPNIVGADETQTAEEAGMLIGSVIGIVIWGFVFLIFAIVTAVIGYVLKKRAGKKLEADDS